MDLESKAALVTGGAVRVGRALVLALADAGCDVFIHYGRSAGPAEEVRDRARRAGVQAEIGSFDLAAPEAPAAAVAAARQALGRLDVLLNSAAIFPDEDSLESTGAELFDRLVAVNLRAPYLASRAFAAGLAGDGDGRGALINILDARVRRPGTDHFVYRLTKRALWTMTENLALELAPRVRVNGVALGAILPPPGRGEEHLQRIADERVPLERPGSPGIVAANVLHLLRQDFLTGVVLPVDGGEFL